jgi:hypothetical protein
MIRPQSLLFPVPSLRCRGGELATPIGLAIVALIIRTVFGAVIVGVVALLLWKASKVLDAYAEKLKAK